MRDGGDHRNARIGDFSIGVWCDDTLFLSGVIGFDAQLGRVVEGFGDLPQEAVRQLATGHFSIDHREGPIVAQAWVAYSLIEATLAGEGLDFGNVIKITHYLTDLGDFVAYSRVRGRFLANEPPASTVVQVSQLLPGPTTRLEVDVVASRGKRRSLGPVGRTWRADG
jgi:enamine deaminase RidA (YjgF/YER057c/UK114 family)